MSEQASSKEKVCFWKQCSDRKRCEAFGSCVAMAQAGGATFPQAMPSSDSPVTQQEIVSAINHHARELARLTATWPAHEPPVAPLRRFKQRIDHGDVIESPSGEFVLYADHLKATSPPTECAHEWVSADNEVVTGGQVCKLCHAIRATPLTK